MIESTTDLNKDLAYRPLWVWNNAMLVLRFVGFLLLITIGASLLIYFITRNRRYLTFAWQVLKYGIVMASIILAFLLFDRLVMVI